MVDLLEEYMSPTKISKKIYELELEKHLDKEDILEDSMKKLYSLL